VLIEHMNVMGEVNGSRDFNNLEPS